MQLTAATSLGDSALGFFFFWRLSFETSRWLRWRWETGACCRGIRL